MGVNNGEVYNFTLPAGCSNGCPTPYPPISYTTSGGGGTSTVSPSPSPSASPSPTSTSQPASGCALTSTVTNSWPGGYQLQLTVSNQGSAASQAWTAGFSFADTAESVTSSWNAAVSQSGQRVSASSESYDGTIPAGQSTSWGMVVTGSDPVLSGLTCSVS
jgi:cellulase/cellobiase CelA1